MRLFKRIVFTIISIPFIILGGIVTGLADFCVSFVDTCIEMFNYVWRDKDE